MSRPKSSVSRPEGGASGWRAVDGGAVVSDQGGEEQQWISRPESGMSRLEDGVSRGPVDEGAVVATQWQVDQCRTRGSGKRTDDK